MPSYTPSWEIDESDMKNSTFYGRAWQFNVLYKFLYYVCINFAKSDPNSNYVFLKMQSSWFKILLTMVNISFLLCEGYIHLATVHVKLYLKFI